MNPTSVRIATHLLGGLGNQLFQYAAGRALARRLNAGLVLDCTERHASGRAIVLDHYPVDADIIINAPGKPHRRHFRLPGTLGRRLTDALHDRVPTTYRIAGHPYKVFGEKQAFTYDPYFEKLTGSIYLTGYWQSYRYFANDIDLIRSEIRPSNPPSDANRAWLDRIATTNSVCLHVRRGDYLPALVCARSYYDRAIQHIERFLEKPRIFVFSDDIAWCRETFAIPDIMYVDANGPDHAVDDLRLMAACRHHIIANSSLSWWGAWLARHPGQVVIAPQPWWPGVTDHKDLIPANWITLSKT
jgi:hypothetical protein